MDYSEVKKELKELVRLCDELPENYRAKCFEVLLKKALDERRGTPTKGEDPASSGGGAGVLKPLKYQVEVEAYLLDFDLGLDSIRNVLAVADGGAQAQVRRNPPSGTKANQQIDWSLLLALRNLVQEGKLVFRPAEVRQTCIDKGCFDQSNWSAIYSRNKDLLVGDPSSDIEIRLSPTGRERLANLIRSFNSPSSKTPLR